jgi:hypothetical protein
VSRKQRKRRKQKAEELFEPEELKRGYLTEDDVNIRRIDKPERFQVRSASFVLSIDAARS